MNFSFKKIQENLYILCVRKLTSVPYLPKQFSNEEGVFEEKKEK